MIQCYPEIIRSDNIWFLRFSLKQSNKIENDLVVINLNLIQMLILMLASLCINLFMNMGIVCLVMMKIQIVFVMFIIIIVHSLLSEPYQYSLSSAFLNPHHSNYFSHRFPCMLLETKSCFL